MHAFYQVLVDTTPEAHSVLVTPVGFEFCRGLEWRLLRLANHGKRPMKAPDIQKRNVPAL